MKNGIELITDERYRQESEEGFTAEHDDAHDQTELTGLAMCYLSDPEKREEEFGSDLPVWYPVDWDAKWWKPTPENRIKELVKAGALIAAEIDRQLRRA